MEVQEDDMEVQEEAVQVGLYHKMNELENDKKRQVNKKVWQWLKPRVDEKVPCVTYVAFIFLTSFFFVF